MELIGDILGEVKAHLTKEPIEMLIFNSLTVAIAQGYMVCGQLESGYLLRTKTDLGYDYAKWLV